MNKNNLLSYFIAFLLGIVSVYGFNYLYFNVINKEEKEIKTIEISDTSISYGINNIYDAVVVVENYKGKKLLGIGSGFIYDKEGLIITNEHVVDSASSIKVILSSKEKVEATVIGKDEYQDIAVLKIDKKYISKVAKIGSNENVKLGDTVFTVGSPISEEYMGTITKGIISSKNRKVEVSLNSTTPDWIIETIQTDAAISPGNSGGPLCNINGEVIGVNTMKLDEEDVEGIGFAIPIENAIESAKRIVNKEEVKKAYMGITMADSNTAAYYLGRYDITPNKDITKGVIVLEVDEEGPSFDAGLKPGDVIIKINNDEIDNVAQLKYFLSKYKPKDKIKVEVIRDNKNNYYDIILDEAL